jgi:hypothetical protein
VRPGRFEERAGVVAGRLPHPTSCEYVVSVDAGRLRVTTPRSPGIGIGIVLDVPVDRVRVEPLGRAGASVVDVDGSPVLVDFTRRDRASGSPVRANALRVVDGLAGRATRRRFRAALGGRGT